MVSNGCPRWGPGGVSGSLWRDVSCDTGYRLYEPHTGNFRAQALYNNIGSYLWNTYLSYLSNKKMDSEDKESNNVVEIDDDL